MCQEVPAGASSSASLNRTAGRYPCALSRTGAPSVTGYESDGRLIEKRHEYGKPVIAHVVTGRMVGVNWRPGILVEVKETVRAVEGSGPLVTVCSTDDRPWALGGRSS